MRVATMRPRKHSQSGIALLTTLLLMVLMSSMLVGFIVLVMSTQRLSGLDRDQSRAFYASEAGMEKVTADLGTLFAQTYTPSGAQINAMVTAAAGTPGGPPALGNGTAFNSARTLLGDALFTCPAGGGVPASRGAAGYEIGFCADGAGNPTASAITINSGSSAYQGMRALATTYRLLVTAQTTNNSEVKLLRTTQSVGIPMFQFGVFSDTDLSFFAGPNFNFGGRTHTNGNLFLAEGDGNTLSLFDKVTAYGEVVRDRLANNYTGGGYDGTVAIATASVAAPAIPPTRNLLKTEGSWSGGIPTGAGAAYGGWTNISLSPPAAGYAGMLRNGKTGVTKLNLAITTLGNGFTQNVDILRRPPGAGEAASVTGERLFAQASFRILLSDNPADITALPCVSGTPPFNLADLAKPVAQWTTGSAPALLAQMNANNLASGTQQFTPLPLAASGATAAEGAASQYNPADGYWLPGGPGPTPPNPPQHPIINGYIKIEIQGPYGSNPCGTWTDVTIPVLARGYVGKNINPVPQSLDGNVLNPMWPGTNPKMEGPLTAPAPPLLVIPNLPTVEMSYQNFFPPVAPYNLPGTLVNVLSTDATPKFSCLDPHPNAIIRLERIRDNPSTVQVRTGVRKTIAPTNLPMQSTVLQVCEVDPAVAANGNLNPAWVPKPYDFWPNVLFDPREGLLRDACPDASNPCTYTDPTLAGVMDYIEIDARNLAAYLAAGGPMFDAAVAPNDFAVYISDRRSNGAIPGTITTAWPPVSPSGVETGEYGYNDFVNSGAANGCPNAAMDTGENLDGNNTLFLYGGFAAADYMMALNPPPALAPSQLANLLPAQFGAFTGVNLVGTAPAPGPGSPFVHNFNCQAGNYNTKVWPGTVVNNGNEARENPNFIFRRAVKLVNGGLLNLGACPGGTPCGLTIAAENPVYIQGDYNANSAGGGFNDPSVGASVMADAVTFLSNSWNDVNSFVFPYVHSNNQRNAGTAWYRTAVIAGKGLSFPQPAGTPQDFGTDGGIHNFLRYIEDWNGTLNYRGSVVSIFYNRQAVGTYKCCTTVYSPPTRGYNFDINFLTPALLPPRTPLFRDINTTGFAQLLLPSQ